MPGSVGKIRWIAFALAAMLASVSAVNAEYVAPSFLSGSTLVASEGVLELAEKEPALVIIDSRLTSDRQHGYLDGSLSLPDEETYCDSLARVIPNKFSPTVFYCNGPHCKRSARAVKVAIDCGYKKVFWFRGGFESWKKEGYPYVRQ